MQNRFGLLNMDVMPMFMIIALDIVITLRFSINCLAVICSPTVLFTILREACSETYGSESIFDHISFRSTILQYFTSPFIYLYQISLLQGNCEGTDDTSPTYLPFLMLFLLFWTLICMI